MSVLYTIADIHRKLPKDAMTLGAFTKLVEEHGTYHEFGKVMLMTERDMTDLLRLTAVRHTRPLPPAPHEAGLMVIVGHPYDKHALVFVGWAPVGQELNLLDRLKEGAQERLMVLSTSDATPADVELFRAKHKKAWRFGKWFGRTDELLLDVRKANEELFPDDDEEGEEVGCTTEVPAEA